jgi:hypothetical protein
MFSLLLGQTFSLTFIKEAFAGTTTSNLGNTPAYALRCGSVTGELRPYGRIFLKWTSTTSGNPPYITPEFTADVNLFRYSTSSGYYEDVGYDLSSALGFANQLLVEAKSYTNAAGQYRADYSYSTNTTSPNLMNNVTVRNLVVCK